MISETVINFSSASGISLDRAKPKETNAGAKDDKKDVEDSINLGVGLDISERLRDAKTTDDLVALIKEGQAEAKANIEKFRALQEERQFGKSDDNSFYKASNDLFEAVRRAVVDILTEESNAEKSSLSTTKTSFDVRLSFYLNEGKVSKADETAANDKKA
ncbi:MAG: hypothetical protein HWE34_11135 [Methylocystaceae bacterium]|nr:hypothetical protein [Methylocystaceae bacterium]